MCKARNEGASGGIFLKLNGMQLKAFFLASASIGQGELS